MTTKQKSAVEGRDVFWLAVCKEQCLLHGLDLSVRDLTVLCDASFYALDSSETVNEQELELALADFYKNETDVKRAKGVARIFDAYAVTQ